MDNKVLKVFKDSDFGLDSVEVDNPSVRNIVRGIIVDQSGSVAVFNKRIENNYQLPGGVVGNDESASETFIKEAKRLIGCNVEIIEDMGILEEHMFQDEMIQKVYVFVGRVLEKGKIDYQNQEVDEFGKVMWVSPEEALKLISDYKKEVNSGEIENLYHAKFSVYRDEFITRYYLINYIY